MKHYVIEGIDCTGKTTQLQALQHVMRGITLQEYTKRKRSHSPVFINTPGSLPLGAEVKALIMKHKPCEKACFLLYQGAYAEIIQTVREAEVPVFFDRSLISGLAYGRLDDTNAVRLFKYTMGTLTIDRLAVLTIRKRDLETRLAQKDGPLDYIENRGVDYLLDIQQGMLDLISKLRYLGFIKEVTIIDSTMSFNVITKSLMNFFNLGIHLPSVN